MKTGYIFCITALLVVSGAVVAADATDSNTAFPIASDAEPASRSSKVIVRKRAAPAQSQGVAVGSFVFIPSLTLTEYHDDNVYATETNTKSDEVTVVSPNFNLKSRWSKHKLDVTAGMDLSRYADLSSENTNDYWLGASGRYDFSARQNVFGGLNFSREHEDRASPDAAAGDTPTEYDDYLAHMGYAFVSGNHRTRIAYTANRFDYKDVTSSGGVIDNNDRDRLEQAVGLRDAVYVFGTDYKYSPVAAVYLEGVVDKREYDITPDYAGNDRNSDGYRYSLGMEYAGSANVLKVFVGSLARDYQSAVFDKQSEFDFGLEYAWRFASLSRFVLQGGRAIEETTFDNSPGYLLTNASAGLQFGFGDKSRLDVKAIKSTADYYGIVRTDDYYDYSLGYTRQLVDYLRFGIELRHGDRESNVAGSDYKINQVFLRVSGVI